MNPSITGDAHLSNPKCLVGSQIVSIILRHLHQINDFRVSFSLVLASALKNLGYRTDQALHVAPKRIAAARTCNSDTGARSFRMHKDGAEPI